MAILSSSILSDRDDKQDTGDVENKAIVRYMILYVIFVKNEDNSLEGVFGVEIICCLI